MIKKYFVSVAVALSTWMLKSPTIITFGETEHNEVKKAESSFKKVSIRFRWTLNSCYGSGYCSINL